MCPPYLALLLPRTLPIEILEAKPPDTIPLLPFHSTPEPEPLFHELETNAPLLRLSRACPSAKLLIVRNFAQLIQPRSSASSSRSGKLPIQPLTGVRIGWHLNSSALSWPHFLGSLGPMSGRSTNLVKITWPFVSPDLIPTFEVFFSIC